MTVCFLRSSFFCVIIFIFVTFYFCFSLISVNFLCFEVSWISLYFVGRISLICFSYFLYLVFFNRYSDLSHFIFRRILFSLLFKFSFFFPVFYLTYFLFLSVFLNLFSYSSFHLSFFLTYFILILIFGSTWTGLYFWKVCYCWRISLLTDRF